MKFELCRQIFGGKKPSNITFHQIRLAEAESFHAYEQADRRTDMQKLTVTFCSFANASKDALMGENTWRPL
jgi:hypothetical protein